MVRARLGVVLPLPAPVAAEVDGLRRALGDRRVDAVPPHITLVPPVNVTPSAVDEALAVVRDAAAASPPLSLVLGPAATFWPTTPVVYLSVGGDVAALARLHHALEGGRWARPTTYPFVPHVTLAQDVAGEHIAAALALFAGYAAEVTITTVLVLREEADGSWAPVEDATLSGRRVVGRGGLEVVLDTAAALGPEATRRLAAVWRPDASPFAITARREGDVVGAAVGVTEDVLWLRRLVVDSPARHQGVGRQLLAAVEALGVSRGCALAVALCPAASPAVDWLSSHGWRAELGLPRWRNGQTYVRMARALR